MGIITKHYYTDGTEIKQYDLVYLKAYDSNHDLPFSGICKIASFDGEEFSFYFLGQEGTNGYEIEAHPNDIEKLIKLDRQAVDIALEKEMAKL